MGESGEAFERYAHLKGKVECVRVASGWSDMRT